MWIKNATVFGFNGKPLSVYSANAFLPTLELQVESSGWSPVRDSLSYTQGLHTLLNFTTEKKTLPKSAVDVLLQERCEKLEEEQGFMPGKKQRKELRERLVDELLPRALASRRSTAVWIDGEKERIVIDSTSSSVVDAVVKALHKTFGDIGICDVAWPRAKVLTEWLVTPPAKFTNDAEVLLQYPGAEGRVVKYAKTNLDDDDVQAHVQKKNATVLALAMTFENKVSFVMTDNAQIKRIKPLDILKDNLKTAGKDADDRFASEFALMAAEMRGLFDTLEEEA